MVEEETDAKNEQFMSFEGLDDEDDDMDIDGEGDSGDDEGF